MTDLRKAAEMALEALETDQAQLHWKIVRALRKALAQPEQEVCWIDKTACKQLQEGTSVTTTLTGHRAFLDDVPLYPALPKREWVGLTDEERDECINGTAWVGEEKEVRVKIVEAIEAKLKEKNHAD
jgi:hypothetical protein